ncbi:MAG: hypothetical protein ACYSSI_04945 [Planctomycetota bacterium]|jgi:hypothetical protein
MSSDKVQTPGQGTKNEQGTNQNAVTPATKNTKRPEKKKRRRLKCLTEEFVPGQTKCRMQGCGHKVMVRSTLKETTGSGNLRVTRNVKCQGPNRHTYTIVSDYKIK